MKTRISNQNVFYPPNAIAVIGCRNVRASSAYSLLMNDALGELILVDEDAERLAGEIRKRQRETPPAHHAPVRNGTLDDAARAAIVIIAGGDAFSKNESALRQLKANARLVSDLARALKRRRFSGILLVITSPVDILTQVAQQASGLPVSRVIGSGTFLETARLKSLFGGNSKVEEAATRIVAEDCETEPATWCAASAGGAPLPEFCTPDCPDFERMLAAMRRAAFAAQNARSCSSFVARTCVNRICQAILQDERMILPVSVKSGGQYGISDVYLNLPAIIGRGGAEKIVELPLGENERKELLESAAVLKAVAENLKREEKIAITGTI